MKNYLITLLALVISVSFSLPANAQQIERGNSIQITITGVPTSEKANVDGMYPVSVSGRVNLPLLGKMSAAGLTPESLSTRIQNAYKSAGIYTNPTIQVISTSEDGSVRKQMVTVGGAVRKSGPILYNRNMTLYQAVQSAGGATPFGAINRLILYRKGKATKYNLNDAATKAIKLLPNDTIEVPQKNLIGK